MALDQWTGGSGNWSDNGDWSLGTAPPDPSTDDVYIGNGTNNSAGSTFADVTSSGNETVNSIAVGYSSIPNNVQDELQISNDSDFTTLDGTSVNLNTGLIFVDDGSTFTVVAGTFNNEATSPGIGLGGILALDSTGDATALVIEDQVTLRGGGDIIMSLNAKNEIAGANSNSTFINDDNTISGGGVITGINFINEANGTIDTNNALGAGTLYIDVGGSYSGGSFENFGLVSVDAVGSLVIGEDSYSTTITNDGTLQVTSTTSPNVGGSYLELNGIVFIAGNVTIQQSAAGMIKLIYTGAPGTGIPNAIVGDGSFGALTIDGGTISGTGLIGGDLLLTIGQGTLVDADGSMVLTGTTVSNDGDAQATAGSELLLTGSGTLFNDGTISADGGTILLEGSTRNDGNLTVTDGGRLHLQGDTTDSAGTFAVGDGALILSSFPGHPSTINGNVTFDSPTALLDFDDSTASINGLLSGIQGGDEIQFGYLQYSAGMRAVWQQQGDNGTLSLTNGGSLLAGTTLDLVGQYTSADFEVIDEGGSAMIQDLNPAPPAGTSADIIMEQSSDGTYEIYDIGQNAILAATALTPQISPEFQVAGLGNFEGADTSDMMMRDSNTGQFEIYDLSDNNVTAINSIGQVGLEWAVAGFGDFSGNVNETDMLMRNGNTGAFEIYDISDNAIYNAAPMGQVGLEWSVAGFGDFSGNANETDMLMRNNNTGAFEIYDISNNQLTSAGPMGQVGLEWSVAGFGDFSTRTNETDMLMRNVNTGAFEIYDISNNQLTSAGPMGAVGLEWSVAGFGDLSGNANETDMLMRNVNTGAFEYYDITGSQLGSAGSMGQVGLAWSVAGIAADAPGGAPSQLAQSMASYAPGSGVIDQTAPPTQTAVQTTAALAAQS